MNIGRILKKVGSIASSVIGVGTGGILATGGTLTGDLIIDGVLILVAGTVIIVNGKEGMPDWFARILESRFSNKEQSDG